MRQPIGQRTSFKKVVFSTAITTFCLSSVHHIILHECMWVRRGWYVQPLSQRSGVRKHFQRMNRGGSARGTTRRKSATCPWGFCWDSASRPQVDGARISCRAREKAVVHELGTAVQQCLGIRHAAAHPPGRAAPRRRLLLERAAPRLHHFD